MSEHLKNELFNQLEEHLKCRELNWLMGAGTSFDAKLPLMYPLTNKVKNDLQLNSKEIFENIILPLFQELPDNCHVEHILSHLGDYIALAERREDKKIDMNGNMVDLYLLEESHKLIIKSISNIIRSGYVEGINGDADEEGTPSDSIVCIESHLKFIDVLCNYASAGIFERRNPINIFTINYDTLLEDALALNRIPYWDGFSGGAVAYRTMKYGDSFPNDGSRVNLIKMHGSIDWHLCDKGYVWRVRDKDRYPKEKNRVLIYPQSTKYIATQQDPFSTQFDLFRKTLNSVNSNVLAVCGYSFGDEHINNEIEFALSKESNKTVLIAFVECKDELPECLERWRKEIYGKRVIVVSSAGMYVGGSSPVKRIDGNDYWWTFSGMTTFLENGWEVS